MHIFLHYNVQSFQNTEIWSKFFLSAQNEAT